jgi:hypothetical protein
VTPSNSPWGSDDEIGRLNRMTQATRAEVLAALDGRWAADLGVDYFLGMPTWVRASDLPFEIWLTHTPSGTIVDDLPGAGRRTTERYSYAGTAFSMYSHTGTHVCSLNHIGIGGRFWNGWDQASRLGSRAWTVGGLYPPIVARAVLLDVAGDLGRERLGESYAVTVADVERSLELHRLDVGPTDVVLIRTGQRSNGKRHRHP